MAGAIRRHNARSSGVRAEGSGATRLVVLVASIVGLGGYLYPFLLPLGEGVGGDAAAHADDAPLLFAAVTGFCLLAILTAIADDHGGVARSKTVALLGVLVALDAMLRLVPSVLGASPIFLLIILVGAVFGATFGFQMGALTVLLSAFITGGVGPWLPYQMLGAGWIGLTAGWLPRGGSPRRRLAVLAIFGALWGFLFGALLNLWFWPFAAPGAGAATDLYWAPGLSLAETVARYARFYLTTSLAFDLFRAIGNAALVLTLGGPALRVLERYRARFTWQPWVETAASGDAAMSERAAPPLPVQ
ncbi:MAG: ECF transporter S component [Chloroflexia bacterium]|nr:ECF transporter S component [Chloroflexia bacterium]